MKGLKESKNCLNKRYGPSRVRRVQQEEIFQIDRRFWLNLNLGSGSFLTKTFLFFSFFGTTINTFFPPCFINPPTFAVQGNCFFQRFDIQQIIY